MRIKHLPAMGLCVVMVFLLSLAASAEEKSVFKGKVLDAEGKAVKGTVVLVYDSPDVRRRADFESARTEDDGKYRMVLLPGKYWALARLKNTGGFGPLMPGDKHSGDPKEIELLPGAEFEMDFTIEEIMAAANRNRTSEDFIRIKGRVLDEKGLPVKNAYVLANRNKIGAGLPDYLSAWTGESGAYTLYLPKGKYHIGAVTVFPPGKGFSYGKELTVESDRSDMDIISK